MMGNKNYENANVSNTGQGEANHSKRGGGLTIFRETKLPLWRQLRKKKHILCIYSLN
jgi:hypothetical protein